MPNVVLYFQMHQPQRLRRYSVFDEDAHYFDAVRNAAILRRVSDRCYKPALAILNAMAEQQGGRFRFSLSVTGVLLEQLREHEPEVFGLLARLAARDEVELLAETYHHSLAWLYSPKEFDEQVRLHARAMRQLTDRSPEVFRNTELIYNDELATWAAEKKYKAVLCEGVDGTNPHAVHRGAGKKTVAVLLRHYGLSDDIAFRFTARDWPGWPLTAEKFTANVTRTGDRGPLCNVFMDLEALGEHQPAESGIFEFLQALPRALAEASKENRFLTASEAVGGFDPSGVFSAPKPISWADTERDVSAWRGNAMQSSALQELFKLEAPVKKSGDKTLLKDWRHLTQSDLFYYMCTKFGPDMAVHQRFNPHESPYDAYIIFMNVLDHLRRRLE